MLWTDAAERPFVRDYAINCSSSFDAFVQKKCKDVIPNNFENCSKLLLLLVSNFSFTRVISVGGTISLLLVTQLNEDNFG